jgi:choline dehydrogenase-like flavoprotein
MTLQPGRIRLEGEDATSARAIAKKAAMKLLRQATRLRAAPLIPAMRLPPPGRGFHTGGSFPMTLAPRRHTSDIEGRPYGFERVHLVDASCLPSIPATPITLPVMANAWRIANRAAERA